jgi:hypothetical protein
MAEVVEPGLDPQVHAPLRLPQPGRVRRATAMMNGQQVWIDDVSRSAPPGGELFA